ncbi:MAG: hypothetical protein WBB23_20105 [Desulforhopalus sp.]
MSPRAIDEMVQTIMSSSAWAEQNGIRSQDPELLQEVFLTPEL